MSTAVEVKTFSISRRPFDKSVLPVDTKSQIASASPIEGAISTDPEIS